MVPHTGHLTLFLVRQQRSFASGLLAAGLGAFLVTPLDVVKTRIQTGGSGYRGIGEALCKIYDGEGVRALFRGASCRVMVMAPLFGIAQMVYFIGVAEKLGIGQGGGPNALYNFRSPFALLKTA
ncbi:unnamed protein product, partial [Mesorhabditis spiculigera]